MTKPQAVVEYRALKDLKELPGNPRTIKKDQFEKLKASIKANQDYFEARPIILSDRTGELVILAGNQRYKAAKALGMTEVPTILLPNLTEEREREIIIRDNVENGDWDWDALFNEWDEVKLDEWGVDVPRPKTYEDGIMTHDFIVPPTTVLLSDDAKWQERKRIWRSRIKSELGRKENLTGFKGLLTKDGYTSIFDPVLCEAIYKWFGIPNGTVLDPFAGGSVRGIVAGWSGLEYFGNDLSAEQVEENRRQADANIDILVKKPLWNVGDSADIDQIIKEKAPHQEFDLLFSCPPYADLEVYSNDPRDISNMDYDDFLKTYRKIIKDSVAHLKPNRFAVFVVGEVRDQKTSKLRGFVQDTIDAFEDAGLKYYNHAVLANRANCGLRVRQHMRTRKLVHAHQDALVFTKGEPQGKNYAQLDPEAEIAEMNVKRTLVDQYEDIVVFTNAQSNDALRESFAEIGGADGLE